MLQVAWSGSIELLMHTSGHSSWTPEICLEAFQWEFYFEYKNRVYKSTKPMTLQRKFFKQPNFSLKKQVQFL